MKRLLITTLIALAFVSARADTLHFQIDSADFNDGTMYVGPYHSTLSGENFFIHVQSFCIDYTSHVGFGQVFSIQTINLADYSGPLKTEYWEAGWLAFQISNTSDLTLISAVQRAMWQITSPDNHDPYLHGPGVEGWIHAAQANYQSIAASTFTLYLKDGVEGQNQLVVGNVPEPGTYAMAAVGLLALIGFNLRRTA